VKVERPEGVYYSNEGPSCWEVSPWCRQFHPQGGDGALEILMVYELEERR